MVTGERWLGIYTLEEFFSSATIGERLEGITEECAKWIDENMFTHVDEFEGMEQQLGELQEQHDELESNNEDLENSLEAYKDNLSFLTQALTNQFEDMPGLKNNVPELYEALKKYGEL